MWKRLNHPNIVPFRGVTFNPLQLISEWIPDGELPKYVEENQRVNLISLVGSSLSTSTQHLTLSSVAGRCRRSRLSALMQRGPRRSQRSACYYLPFTPLLTEISTAKYCGRRIRKRTNHGLRSRNDRPRSKNAHKRSR